MTISSTSGSKLTIEQPGPMRLALAGVSHDHISILELLDPADFILVGAYDPDREILAAFGSDWGVADDKLYGDLNAMLDETRPDAVAAFGPISEHLAVVEACAPRHVHVMVEKPLAIGLEEARRMVVLAAQYDIHVLTNYETSWYPSTAFALKTARSERALGTIRKVLVRDGHPGPIESGCRPAFLAWLTDPELSGGGALTDFGCYGANLMTAIMDGRRPLSVTAQTHRFKPDLYPLVEDDALIVLNYGDAETVIQASWAWPMPRKDMEIYGDRGFVAALDDVHVEAMLTQGEDRRRTTLPGLPPGIATPFAYFAGVLRGAIALAPSDLASLENNLVVTEILAAAQRSAAENQTIFLG